MFNPIFKQNVQGRKHPGSYAVAEPELLSIRKTKHGGPSEAGDCSHPPPKMATAENPTSDKAAFGHVTGYRSL